MDFKIHYGGRLAMLESCGTIASGSVKLKLNIRSSRKSELVTVDNFVSKMIWTWHFMFDKGYLIEREILFQEKNTQIILETKGERNQVYMRA